MADTVVVLTAATALAAVFIGHLSLWRGHERRGYRLTSLGWVAFAAFWLLMLPTFALEMRSIVETLLALVCIPLSLSAAVLCWRGHEGIQTLSRALGITGVLYAAAMVPPIRQALVETVATHTAVGIDALGYDPIRQSSAVHGFDSEFVFVDDAGNRYVTYIVLACTGIGAIATFTGLIFAASAPLARKLKALAVVVVGVWLLNIARNVFIAVAFGDQWFQAGPLVALTHAVGYQDPALASYFVADRLISQSLSVLAVLVLVAVVVRLVPASKTLFETVLEITTRRTYDIDPQTFTLRRKSD